MDKTNTTQYAAGDKVRISANPRPASGDYVAPSFAGTIGVVESSETTSAGSYAVRVGSLVQYVSPESLTPVAPERTAVERELHPTGDEATDLAIYHAEMAATYKGRDDSVRIPKADLLLILAAARR